jgi:AcrR family transcriptional regulator
MHPMVRANSSRQEPPAPATGEAVRLARGTRRDALLDAAAELVATGDIEEVSMEAVAERARVSRPLVYKHFANRVELLAALYTRETSLLHAELAAEVTAADTLEETFRALIRGALRAQATRGATFAALRAAGLRTRERRAEQHERDRGTVRYFAARAVRELNLDSRQARAAVTILLGAIDAVLAQWRAHPTRDAAVLLEDTYVTLVIGGLQHLARPLGAAVSSEAARHPSPER